MNNPNNLEEPPMDPGLRVAEYELRLCEEEYRDGVSLWNSLEAKAQGSTAVAGIFLAALSVYLENLIDRANPLVLTMILISSLALVVSVIMAMVSLRVRKVPAPVLGRATESLVADLVAVTDAAEQSQRIPLFLRDQSAKWRGVNEALRGVIEGKARSLTWSQGSLVLAILSAGFVVILDVVTALTVLGGTG